MNIVLVGLFGSGKTTLANAIARKFNLEVISSTGFRKWLDSKNIQYDMRCGKRPEPKYFFEYIKSIALRRPDGLIFDNIYTVDGLNTVIANCHVDKFIYLKIDEQTAIDRVTMRGREDLSEEFLNRRKKTFYENIDEFKRVLGGKLLTVDAMLPVEQLHCAVFELL